jgi:hypothetical protein
MVLTVHVVHISKFEHDTCGSDLQVNHWQKAGNEMLLQLHALQVMHIRLAQKLPVSELL